MRRQTFSNFCLTALNEVYLQILAEPIVGLVWALSLSFGLKHFRSMESAKPMPHGRGSNSLSNFYLVPKSVVALSLAADKRLDNTLREKFSRIMITEFFSG
ncbi:hypothetical protein [Candidatus Hadarchaeum sp.]|uniref:hypothetical protein n=1 Tax=Candidatus Hadarchaeum sp. TaxID=2883567 RepID=UPI00319D89FC